VDLCSYDGSGGLMKCYRCGKPADTILSDSNLPVCKLCFSNYIERKVIKTIRHYKMLKYNDTIGIAYSGGKDSVVLLHILYKIEQSFPQSKVIVITIDEGIRGYREEALKAVRKNVDLLDVEWHLFSFKELYGNTLDEILSKAAELAMKNNKKRLSACTYCGILRRKALDYAAKELGVTKLAAGHNLDDETQTLLINLLKGDVDRIGRLMPIHDQTTRVLVPRIKPLRKVSEREVVLYAYYNGLEYQSRSCPYAAESIRSDVRLFLNEIEKKIPSVKHNLLHALDTLSPLLRKQQEKELKYCKHCGYPTSQDLCKSCILLSKLNLLDKQRINFFQKI